MATYYIDEVGGNDANNGTTTATPKKTFNGASGVKTVMADGDIVYGQGEGEDNISFASSIASRQFLQWPGKPRWVLRGDRLVAALATSEGSGVWSTALADANAVVGAVYLDGQRTSDGRYIGQLPSSATLLALQGATSGWSHPAGSNKLYIKIIGGAQPAANTIRWEIGSTSGFFVNGTMTDCIVQGLIFVNFADCANAAYAFKTLGMIRSQVLDSFARGFGFHAYGTATGVAIDSGFYRCVAHGSAINDTAPGATAFVVHSSDTTTGVQRFVLEDCSAYPYPGLLPDGTTEMNPSVTIDAFYQHGRTTAITAISQASPTIITAASHAMATGDVVYLTGTNSNPTLSGPYTVDVLTANTFNIRSNGVLVNVTVGAGTTGTVVNQVIKDLEFRRCYVKMYPGTGGRTRYPFDGTNETTAADVKSWASYGARYTDCVVEGGAQHIDNSNKAFRRTKFDLKAQSAASGAIGYGGVTFNSTPGSSYYESCEFITNTDKSGFGVAAMNIDANHTVYMQSCSVALIGMDPGTLPIVLSWLSQTGNKFYARDCIFALPKVSNLGNKFMAGDSGITNGAGNQRDILGCDIAYVTATYSADAAYDTSAEWLASVDPQARFLTNDPFIDPYHNLSLNLASDSAASITLSGNPTATGISGNRSSSLRGSSQTGPFTVPIIHAYPPLTR